MAVVEAEGVGGSLYFAGWGNHLGEAGVVAGRGNHRAGIVKIGANPWHFLGEESRPAPRKDRCVLSRSTPKLLERVRKARMSHGVGQPFLSVFDKVNPSGVRVSLLKSLHRIHHHLGEFCFTLDGNTPAHHISLTIPQIFQLVL
ncbi:MAG: hypothetical protein GY822_29255 [Deltaproteobacteria bacterium]|nr:hypothetical protein [Deltaproteobacteria bacterium]